MNSKRIFWSLVIFTVVFIFLLGACSQTGEPERTQESVTIKVAVIPVMDTLPMYVAEKEDLFVQHSLQVEFIPVGSAAERDQLIAAGQADAMVNEVLSTMFYNKESVQVQIVRYARTATAEKPLFQILVAGNSGINSPEDLGDVEIAISDGTVIAYLTDRLMQQEGFRLDEIKTVAVPKIPDRMALLASGELKAAMLPDPLTFLAVQQGASIILDDTQIPELSFSTISFRKVFIDEHPEAVRGFLAAIEEATQKINKDPNQYASLLTERELVPAPILEAYQINPYPTAGVPTEAQWEDVLSWAKEKGLLELDIAYVDSVTDAYLP